jgi:prepilin-type N-terminal cleavage/methylation domain-containing protein
MSNRRSRRRARRDGLTLIELLIVILIAVVLLGAALPIMRTSIEGRAVREASRQLNTYVQLAKSRAAETGRPVGLWLELETLPEDNTVKFATQLFLAETPPPYAGDLVGATIQVSSAEITPGSGIYQATFSTAAQQAASASFYFLIEVGDHIKFDYRGPAYEITGLQASASPPIVTFARRRGEPGPRDGEMKYQVLRTPQKSSSSPMEFTGDAVVDLNSSGLGLFRLNAAGNAMLGGEFRSATTPVVIMFTPQGSVQRILGGGVSAIPTSTVHLLVGRFEQMIEPGIYVGNATANPLGIVYNRNLEDTTNLWVSIGHQTGKVITADNAWFDQGTLVPALNATREFAQQAQSKGGR